MARPVEAKIVMENGKRYVNVQYADHARREHCMDIAVRVDHGGVVLTEKRYDGQLFFPLSILPILVKAIEEQAGETLATRLNGV